MQLDYRQASELDLVTLIKLLADDELGKTREDSSLPINPSYLDIFKAIQQDSNNELIVAEKDNVIVAMLQITYIPYLTYKGSWRALVEGVRVDQAYRGKGIGRQMLQWAISQAKQKNCTLIQLTSDKKRQKAIQFYQSLGFVDSHEGFKLHL